jgi:hypothetical protein
MAQKLCVKILIKIQCYDVLYNSPHPSPRSVSSELSSLVLLSLLSPGFHKIQLVMPQKHEVVAIPSTIFDNTGLYDNIIEL